MAALLVPGLSQTRADVGEIGPAGRHGEALVVSADVVDLFQRVVEGVNATLAPFETIKRFALLPSELTITGGELTPTMKVRRRVVEQRWRTVIDALYEETIAQQARVSGSSST